ncbi:MAG: PorV/PorQ family protein [Calditrichaeota bacterium]|nr:PorV/PorQ family protein [Calditrichota bacterium]MCB9367852.1 PorV/PorQ family protein [Calditrichota bacterium]
MNKKFCRTVLAIVIVLVACAQSFALEKVGTTSMQLLKLPLGVRGLGMANAFVAAAEGAESVWWNPGALTTVEKNHVQIAQINLPADIQCNALSYARPWGKYGAMSVHVINLFTNDMPVRTWEAPEGTGEYFNAYDFVIGGSYAQRLTDKFSLGGNLRYLRSGLENESYDGFSVDLGTVYHTGLRSLVLGMAIQNLGPEVKYSGQFADYREAGLNSEPVPGMENFEGASLPTMFRLGVSFDMLQMLEVEHNESHSTLFAIEMDHPNDNKERLNFGGEYGYQETLFLRAGGKFGYDEESFSLGFGLRFDVMNEYTLDFDYGYAHWGRITSAGDGFMDQPHRFAVAFAW